MRIYTHVEIDMRTGRELDAQSFFYTGPVAECKGGSSGGGDTIDKAYNRRMASIAEAQQGMAEEMFSLYKYGDTSEGGQLGADGSQLGLEQAQTAWNQSIVDSLNSYQGAGGSLPEQQAQLYEQQLGLGLSQAGWEQEQVDAMSGSGLAEKQTGLALSQADTAMQRNAVQQDFLGGVQSSGLTSNYLREAQEGVNTQDRMGQAQGDVAAQYAAQQGANRMQASRMGLDPNSGQFGRTLANTGLDRAKDIAAARTGARTQAQQEEFQRLSEATRLGLG